MDLRELKILIKGAGEMATGIAHRLHVGNITRIVMTEMPDPLNVRRTVSFSEAVSSGTVEVEGVRARLIGSPEELPAIWNEGQIAVIIDPQWTMVNRVNPHVVVDAIMAKRNLGTMKTEAALVVGVGPGFEAPEGVHAVVESNRGHNLGRVIYRGAAEPYTGIPGPMMGYTTERVLRAPFRGIVTHVKEIGDPVKKGDAVLYVGQVPIIAPFDGVLRGLIREMEVTENEKIGDIDPSGIRDHCFTITEKARAIGGGVLEAVLHHFN